MAESNLFSSIVSAIGATGKKKEKNKGLEEAIAAENIAKQLVAEMNTVRLKRISKEGTSASDTITELPFGILSR